MAGVTVLSVTGIAACAALMASTSDSFAAAPSSVCVVMFSTPNIVPLYAGVAARINQAYAARHGYTFRHHVYECPEAVPAWYKIFIVRRELERHAAVFWIDSDAAFNKHAHSLQKWLDAPEDMVACSDHPNGPYAINTGTMLVKSTPWSKAFFDEWWTKRLIPPYSNTFAYEQTAFHDMLQADFMGCTRRVRIEEASAFNSVYGELKAGKRDTFVLHFMAYNSDDRRVLLQQVWDTLKLNDH